jgi:hypothetical protein
MSRTRTCSVSWALSLPAWPRPYRVLTWCLRYRIIVETKILKNFPSSFAIPNCHEETVGRIKEKRGVRLSSKKSSIMRRKNKHFGNKRQWQLLERFMNVMQLWGPMCPLIRSLVPLSSRSRLGRMLILSCSMVCERTRRGLTYPGEARCCGAARVLLSSCCAVPVHHLEKVFLAANSFGYVPSV